MGQPLELRAAPVDGVLVIDGVLAEGRVVEALLDRLRRSDPVTLASLRGVFGPSIAVIVGPTDALPWVDGVRHLRRAEGEPNLLLPTDVRLDLAPSLVLRAFLQHAERPRPPIVLVPERRQFLSIADARSMAPPLAGEDR